MAANEGRRSSAENTPLLPEPHQKWLEAYSSKETCTVDEQGIVLDYDTWRLSSLRVLRSFKATLLMDPVLIFEQFLLTGLFLLAAVPSYMLQSKLVGFSAKADRRETHQSLVEQEANIRKFSLIVTTLAAFLLSLYTSIMIGRWWGIRAVGIGSIKGATMDLSLNIAQFVTKDPEVHSAIRRYSRASLRLVFLWRRSQLKDQEVLKRELVEPEILTEEELGLLLNYNHNLHESIWTWQVGIVKQLYQEGLIKEQMLVFLLDKCSQGRAGVQSIATYVTVKVPMQYVHLLGFIVKLHNLLVATLMGILFSRAVKDRRAIVCLQLYGRTILLPLLFNAILLINAKLADPFDGGQVNFPKGKYDKGFENDGSSFLEAGKNLPTWLQERSEKAKDHKG